MNTKEVTVTLKERGSGLYEAFISGQSVGITATWFEGTFAAGYKFGILARNASGLDVKGHDRAIHYLSSPESALQVLKDLISDHLDEYGVSVTFEMQGA